MPKVRSKPIDATVHELIDKINELIAVNGKSRLVIIADFDSANIEACADRIIEEARSEGEVRKAVMYVVAPSREDLV